ncbi:MAG: glutamate--tRNA ligase family protein, partial [Acidiferrobacterales bacterium]
EDHISNTPRQILILQALGLPVPDYAHIALVVAANGAPLSKRAGSRTIRELRDTGFLPIAVNNYLARLGHTYYDDTFMTLGDLADGFELTHVSHSPARFDEAHLMHWQREAVHTASDDALWAWVSNDELLGLVPADKRAAFISTVRANITMPTDAREWARIIFTDNHFALGDGIRDVLRETPPTYFDQVLKTYETCAGKFDAFGQLLQDRTGRRGAAAYRPVRLALTGRERGPELVRLLEIMSADRIRRRLLAAKEVAENRG